MKKTTAIIVILVTAITCAFCAGWELYEEKDDFGDPTGKKEVVLSNQKGTFNSSPAGVTNGNLEWEFHSNADGAWFILKENGADETLSTAYYKSDTFTIKVKKDDGNVVNLQATIGLNGSAYNKVVLKYPYNIESIFADNSSPKIVISCDNGNGSYSLGNIDSSGTEELFFSGKSILQKMYEAKTHLDYFRVFDELETLDDFSLVYYGSKIIKFYEESFKVNLPGYAGGIIIYDCDADNASGNADGLRSQECGWRYLEAAPADLKIIVDSNGQRVPTVDASSQGYSDYSTKYKFIFGYQTPTVEYYVNGTTTYNASNCTGTAIGTGESNTKRLVKAMGEKAYKRQGETWTDADYAARLCDVLTFTNDGMTYDDWFLPSKDELSLFLDTAGRYYSDWLGKPFAYSYWTSSEYEKEARCAYEYSQYNKGIKESGRDDFCSIRPFRTF